MRVKSVINGETIQFVNTYYEKKGSEITKYYYAGASQVAARKYTVPESTTLHYMIGNHLGSASVVMDDAGTFVSETRYKPWGEVRYTTANKTLPTRYTFTGQYSHMDDSATDLGAAGFGLMFYNARWYDPLTGRFAQADTVVPGGVQGLDRYAYTKNNPVKYIDPSGHESVCGYSYSDPDCPPKSSITEGSKPKYDNPINFEIKKEGGESCNPNDLNCLINDWWVENRDEICEGLTNTMFLCDPNFWEQADEMGLDILRLLPEAVQEGLVLLLTAAAVSTQDLATLVDFIGIVAITALTLASCPGGCWEGAMAGLFLWVTALNPIETGLSLSSLGFTFFADIADDGQLGESFYTSLATAGAGTVAVDPLTDFLIDGYSSGYNHGLFCGIFTIIICASGELQ